MTIVIYNSVNPIFSLFVAERCHTLTLLIPDMKTAIDSLRSGNARALARAISTVENHAPGSIELLKELFPHTGRARTIGLTGAPGAGKSTLVDQLAKHYRKTENPHPSRKERGLNGAPCDEHYRIGIIALDPTSPYTGGPSPGD